MKKMYEDDFFSYQNTLWIRGISALLIVLIHSIQNLYTGDHILFTILSKFGIICVSAYFFLSGYGLIYSALTKKDYLNKFFLQRFVKLFVPVYCIELLYLLYYSFTNGITVNELLYLPFFIKWVRFSWFVVSILVCYVVFYFCFKYINKDKSFFVFLLSIIGIVGICVVLKVNPMFYQCIPAFILGSSFAKYYREISIFLHKTKYQNILFCYLLFLLVCIFISRFIHPTFKTAVYSICTGILLVVVELRFKIKSIVITKLSNISYELYLVHGLVIMMVSHTSFPFLIQLFIVYAVSIFTSFMVNFVDKKIITMMLN